MDDYSSDYEPATARRKADAKRKSDLITTSLPTKTTGLADRRVSQQAYDKERWLAEKQHLIGMTAVERHQEMVKNYLLYYGGRMEDFRRDTSKDRDDVDVLRANHRFLWTGDVQEEAECAKNWERRLAKKYYDKLYREFAIADLTYYQVGKLAMRWRTESEVLSGKGQFECGAKRCDAKRELATWEVNFAYMEDGMKKNALVKLRLCPECSAKLNYKHAARRVAAEVSSPTHSKGSRTEAEAAAASSSKRRVQDDTNSKLHSSDAGPSNSKKRKDESDETRISELEKRIWSAPADTRDVEEADEQRNLDEEIDSFLKSMLV